MSYAIHYTPVRPPSQKDQQIYGLQVAIADLLRAVMRHARTEKINFLIADQQEAAELQDIARQAGLPADRLALLDRRFDQNFTSAGTIFRAEPDTRDLLWRRQSVKPFGFCGLAHAISGTEAGSVLQEYILAPSEDTDALICPSRAVRDAIRGFWDNYADYLGRRFGAAYRCPVQLPVIPLGIDIDAIERKTTPDKRAAQRQALSLADDEIVLLWVGRLSAAIKAHPLAMFRAAEEAARRTGRKIHLVMQGYFVPAEAEASFRKLAAATCKTARVSFVAANDARFPDGLWAAGDIFLSLIDNLQESFGLTPIEAMAAGLPRVLSDWDGYRDSVTDGEDGFLIRTLQPPPGQGFDLTAQIVSGREVYGGFLAKAALTTFVDADQAAERIAQLAENLDLRRTMADKARARAKAQYDWRVIVPAYEDLWTDLTARRAAAPPARQTWTSATPLLPDPYTMYAGFPTAALAETTVIKLVAPVEAIAALWSNDLNTYANDVFVPPADIAAVLGWIEANGPARIGAVIAAFPQADAPRLWRTLAWFLKLGITRISD